MRHRLRSSYGQHALDVVPSLSHADAHLAELSKGHQEVREIIDHPADEEEIEGERAAWGSVGSFGGRRTNGRGMS